jgi:hypothetical protein
MFQVLQPVTNGVMGVPATIPSRQRGKSSGADAIGAVIEAQGVWTVCAVRCTGRSTTARRRAGPATRCGGRRAPHLLVGNGHGDEGLYTGGPPGSTGGSLSIEVPQVAPSSWRLPPIIPFIYSPILLRSRVAGLASVPGGHAWHMCIPPWTSDFGPVEKPFPSSS